MLDATRATYLRGHVAMWALTNRTPYAAERSWVRDKRGMHHWVVAVKATFAIAEDGALTLADAQLPPLLAPEHFGEPAVTSVRYDTDVGPVKPATDVLVNASAHAPGGRPARAVSVALRIDGRQKVLTVYGDRVYQETVAGVVAREAAPFVTQPIRYELAYGGVDTRARDPLDHAIDPRNPIGRGFAVDRTALVGARAHVIEHADGDDASRGPAGFGAIACSWAPRLAYAGTYDGAWARSKRPLLPDDYDDRFTLSAPVDQRFEGHLRGGERFELVHMTPGGVLRFTLPTRAFTFRTAIGRRREEHHARLATVLVEPDDARLVMTWQTSLAVASRDTAYLDQTVVTEA
ncbi:MAG: DUF2169 domain-containing protein [Polyangiales bacterium]